MPPSPLSAQVRAALEGKPDSPPLDSLLGLVDDFVLACANPSAEGNTDAQVHDLEDELQSIHKAVVDSVLQTEIFLAVLYHLSPVLPPTSVISWFDLVLRPALREPKLPTLAVDHAKELIISALQTDLEGHWDRVGDFRRRLLELYLLDAFNESSGEDVLEWAELSQEDRDKRTRWKQNLEDILLRFGNQRPVHLLDEINTHFQQPSSRLQLLSLLNVFSCSPYFRSAAEALPDLPLMTNILLSLFLDNSSTVATLGVTLLVKLLPFFAVYARERLKEMLPQLLAILARIMCWKERRASRGRVPSSGESVDVDLERELEHETNPVLGINPDIKWERLDMTFNATTSLPPQSRNYFTLLYYLYPSNVLRFLRDPVQYLDAQHISSPYVKSWKEALDQDEIRRRSENLVREHNCHPLIVWRDAVVELQEPEFWLKYDISRIISEAPMLDLRNLALGLQMRYAAELREEKQAHSQNAPPHATSSTQQHSTIENHDRPPSQNPSTSPSHQPDDLSPRFIRPIDLTSGKVVISLQDMINTTIALKSNLDVDVLQPSSQWPDSLFTSNSIPSSHATTSMVPEVHVSSSAVSLNTVSSANASSIALSVGSGIHSSRSSIRSTRSPPHTTPVITHPPTDDLNAVHVTQAISGLQREVLLLRNDLNFELWLARENAKHIGRLYQDRILMKTAEAERQGLYNKLRKYRAEVIGLQGELREHKLQASNAKHKYADWNAELHKKLKELREEKKSWISEAASLRSLYKEKEALFTAQGALLADATKAVFELQTQRKENQHKIDRLHDYEAQIGQHIKVQKTWDADFAKFNAREEDIKQMQIESRQHRMRVDCLESTVKNLEDEGVHYRRTIQMLEGKLLQVRQKHESPSIEFATEKIKAHSADHAALISTNAELRDENNALKDEVQELTAMVELLRAQHAGQGGLVSSPRNSLASPLSPT